MVSKYETSAGYVTRADAFSKLLHLLREAEDQCYVISHLHRTEDSKREELMATGYRAIGQMLALVRKQVVELAKGKNLQ